MFEIKLPLNLVNTLSLHIHTYFLMSHLNDLKSNIHFHTVYNTVAKAKSAYTLIAYFHIAIVQNHHVNHVSNYNRPKMYVIYCSGSQL